MIITAPITLFTYNRPSHTKQTIDALLKNKNIEQAQLYVFSDAPKNETDIEKVKDVRRIVKDIKGVKSLEVIESTSNKGLATSIKEGVSSVVNQYGKVIVLEDDLVTSEGFFNYMNDALYLYENDEEVMHVSAYVLPVKQNLPETFFFNQASCWGWGTWARAWKNYIDDPEYLKKELNNRNLVKKFNIDYAYDYSKQLQENIDGVINTWAVKWQASIILNNGLCLHPCKSLVQNMGLDWSGMHTGPMKEYVHDTIINSVDVKKNNLTECISSRKILAEYYKKYHAKKNILTKFKEYFKKHD